MMRFIFQFAFLHLQLQSFSASASPRNWACVTRPSPLVGGVWARDYIYLFSWFRDCCTSLKAQHNHSKHLATDTPIGSAYSHKTWAYLTDVILATVAFLLLGNKQSCFPEQTFLTTHSYLTLLHGITPPLQKIKAKKSIQAYL